MSLNPMSVLVSIKTLRPEVDDYWLSIPAAVKTIDELKQHILFIECIDRDIDVELYLSDGLLRGNASICDVIRDRDSIEIRVKCADKKAEAILQWIRGFNETLKISSDAEYELKNRCHGLDALLAECRINPRDQLTGVMANADPLGGQVRDREELPPFVP
ncbi:unnamed protein product [Medioppia subpectinata]|uniref:Uncharacterized protein n=1 Tax=Medioppia subpectinata TaxID=1979941 RepID=A0A7R9PVR7_9ACAR|nr:unnamed protein product [Medioppia subpectinata]CAG2102948.1 unnamed protein product [Medioppia subpectinata]